MQIVPDDWNAEFADGTKPKWWALWGLAIGFFTAALVGTSILAVGLAGGLGTTSRAGASDVVTLVTGERIYTARCASCHGDDGEGGVGLPLGNGAVVEEYPFISRQIAVINEGRNAMPAFANLLSAAEIEAVAMYEREQLGRDGN